MTGGHVPKTLEQLGFTQQEIDAATGHSYQGLTIKGLMYRAGIASLHNYNDSERMMQRLAQASRTANSIPSYRPGEYRTASAAGNLSTIDIPNGSESKQQALFRNRFNERIVRHNGHINWIYNKVWHLSFCFQVPVYWW